MPAHYWPADPKLRALTDSFLEYYQQSFRPAVIAPLEYRLDKVFREKPFDEESWTDSLPVVYAELDVFEVLLKRYDGRFVVCDEPTIADLQLFFEFQSMEYNRFEWKMQYPRIKQWYNDMLTLPNVKTIVDEWMPVKTELARTIDDI